MRVHTIEKPYACNVCLNTFTVNRSLLRHTKVYFDEKPYTWYLPYNEQLYGIYITHTYIIIIYLRTTIYRNTLDACLKTFNRNNSLTCHERIHTGKKSYFYEVCLKTYLLNKNLKRCMRTQRVNIGIHVTCAWNVFTERKLKETYENLHGAKSVHVWHLSRHLRTNIYWSKAV